MLFSPETGSTSAPEVSVGSRSIFLLKSTISSLCAVWELKRGASEIPKHRGLQGDCEVLLPILCPQREQSSPLITPAPQNSLLDPESLCWHLASTLAAAMLALLPLERTYFYLGVWSHTLEHRNFRACSSSRAGLWPGWAVAEAS